MESFERYMAALDGSTDWETIGPLFDETFHADCIFVTADGEMNKAQWTEMAKGLRSRGVVVTDFAIDRREGDALYYQLTLTPGGGDAMKLAAKGTVKDGQIIRVEPVDPGAYSDMVRMSS